MFFEQFEQMEIFSCKLELEANNRVQRQIIEAPRIMIERQFMSLVEQSVQSASPIKVRLSRDVPIFNDFENKWTTIENEIVFKNKAYVSMENQENEK